MTHTQDHLSDSLIAVVSHSFRCILFPHTEGIVLNGHKTTWWKCTDNI